jgi:hypothetical protein
VNRFDAIRAAHPHLAISLYALTPGGPVVLEVIDGEHVETWSGESATAVMDVAFPPETHGPIFRDTITDEAIRNYLGGRKPDAEDLSALGQRLGAYADAEAANQVDAPAPAADDDIFN